jgi:competence protein ComFC
MMAKRGFEAGFFGFYFEHRLREAIHAFKFAGRKDVGRKLVGLLSKKIIGLSAFVDYIVPMPVSAKRLKERGFNQSYIIAEELSRMIGKPVLHSSLLKVKETKDQYTLSKEERRKNVKGAFGVADTRGIRGKRVLLVDDLFTTGHTAAEASRALSRSGAKETVFFALARTP